MYVDNDYLPILNMQQHLLYLTVLTSVVSALYLFGSILCYINLSIMLLTAACDQARKRRKWTKQEVEHLTDSSDIYEAFKSAVDPELFEVCSVLKLMPL